MRIPVTILATLFASASLAPFAHAHGDLGTTIPARNSTVNEPPTHLVVNFTEPPTKDAVVTIRDGCGRSLAVRVDVEDRVAHLYTKGGLPGEWRVTYDVISAVDGHRTSGGYSFKVAGKRDCTPDKKFGDLGKGPGEGPGPVAGDEGDDPPGEESGIPVLPIVVGSVAVVALAIVVRRMA